MAKVCTNCGKEYSISDSEYEFCSKFCEYEWNDDTGAFDDERFKILEMPVLTVQGLIDELNKIENKQCEVFTVLDFYTSGIKKAVEKNEKVWLGGCSLTELDNILDF